MCLVLWVILRLTEVKAKGTVKPSLKPMMKLRMRSLLVMCFSVLIGDDMVVVC
jgi:hypothetical protein